MKNFFFCSLRYPFTFPLGLILCLFLGACASQEKSVKKAELHHKLAHSLMKKCQYPSAFAELEKAIKLKPDRPVFHHSLALLYFQFKKYKKTIKHFKTALKLSPKFTDARIHLGRSLIETGRWEEGMKELEKAKEDLSYKYPENIHTHIGLAFYKKKQYPKAEKHFSVARTMKKESCSTALYHARSLYFQGQFKKSLAILEPAKKWCETNLPLCSPPSYDAYFFSALIYNKQGQRQKAFLNLRLFLDKAKDSPYIKSAEKYITLWKGIN